MKQYGREIFFLFLVSIVSSIHASIHFGSPESRLLLKPGSRSIFKTSQPKKIIGWEDESIVRGHSGVAATTWDAKLEASYEYGSNKLDHKVIRDTKNLADQRNKRFRAIDENTIYFSQNSTSLSDTDIGPLDMFRLEPLDGTSNWVNRNAGVTNLALRAFNLAQNAQHRITGLQQSAVFNNFDITGTSTSSYTYTDTQATNSVIDIAWHPLGQHMAIARQIGVGLGGGPYSVTINFANSLFGPVYSSGGGSYTEVSFIDSGFVPQSLKWNPAGDILAIGANGSQRAKVYLARYNYQAGTMDLIATILDSTSNSNATVKQVDWSPDGRYLAVVGSSLSGSGASTKQLHIYKAGAYDSADFGGYGLAATWQENAGANHTINAVSWHPSGKFLVIGGDVRRDDGGNPRINTLKFDGTTINSIYEVFTLIAGSESYTSFSYSPSGRYFAVGSNSKTRSGMIFEVSPLNSIIVYNTPYYFATTTTVNSVAWSPSGNEVVWSHNGYELYSFKSGNFSRIETSRGYAYPIKDVEWLPTGKGFTLAGRNQDGFIEISIRDATITHGLARTTSNWVNKQFSDFGSSMLGRQLRGTSNWVYNQYVDAGNNAGLARNLRGTSNAMNAQQPWLRATSRYLSGTSNLVLAQQPWLRATSRYLSGTSNWVYNQVADLGSANVGTRLRGTSNWVANNGDSMRRALGLGGLSISTATYSLSAGLQLGNTGTIVFTSNCVFDGNNNEIRLTPGVASLINAGLYQVVFKNVRFTNVDFANFAGANIYFGSNVTLDLSNEISTLQSNMKISGAVIIKGNHQRFKFDTKTISITEQGTLTFIDTKLMDVQGNPFIVTRDANVITFDNSVLHLTRNFTFTKGAMLFMNDVKITGTSVFSYESNITSSIAAASMLTFDTNTTFSYSPKSARNRLLEFVDASSILFLNSSTIKTTTTGIKLIGGSVLIDGAVSVYNDGAVAISESVVLGGISSSSQLAIIIMPSASFNIKSGILNYLNPS